MANSVPKIVYDAGAGDVTIQFEYPPLGLDFEGKSFKAIQKVSESTGGGYQTSHNYTEDERNLTFAVVKESILTEVQTFLLDHGLLGGAFKYYIHSDESEFDTLEISKKSRKFRPKRTGWNSNGDFTYNFKLKMRQAI